MRRMKYRLWNKQSKIFLSGGLLLSPDGRLIGSRGIIDYEDDFEIMQWTGLQIRGVDLYEDDIVEFTDKWEWYKGTYAIKMMFAEAEEKKELKAKFDAEPMYRFVVEYDPFEGVNLSSYDLAQDRYQIIGNKFQDSHLLKEEHG